ncbi:hypothetical protein BDFG_09254 [Blastomyces dermatitidis ATCC 26199]|nr:hypothetical protein BDFG_09254 [Blastomyces dermatitidis ATCC 26199]
MLHISILRLVHMSMDIPVLCTYIRNITQGLRAVITRSWRHLQALNVRKCAGSSHHCCLPENACINRFSVIRTPYTRRATPTGQFLINPPSNEMRNSCQESQVEIEAAN